MNPFNYLLNLLTKVDLYRSYTKIVLSIIALLCLYGATPSLLFSQSTLNKEFLINEQTFQANKLILTTDSLKSILGYKTADSLVMTSTLEFYLNVEGLHARKGLVLDFENKKSVDFPVKAIIASAVKLDTLKIFVQNVDEPPKFDVFEPITFVKENVQKPVFIGLFNANDPDSAFSITYELFLIDDSITQVDFIFRSDSLFINDKVEFNYEAKKQLSFTIQATDSSFTTIETFVINLTDEPEAPSSLIFTNDFILENRQKSQVIDTIWVQDEDIGDVIELTSNTQLVDINRIQNKAFTLSISDSSYFNYEVNKQLTLILTAEDKTSLSFTREVSYKIIDINEKPSLVIDSLVSTNEDSSVNLVFEVTDPETISSKLHYQLSSNNPFLLREIDYEINHLVDNSYNLVLNPIHNSSGEAKLKFTVSDQELNDTAEIDLVVRPVNDIPTLSSVALNIRESDTKVIGKKEVNISDIDNLPTEINFQIQRFPDNGSLFFGDSLLTSSSFIFSYYDIITNKLAYRHDGNESVSDTIGLSYFDLDSPIQNESLLVHIKPVNDAPYFVTNFFPIYLSESDSTKVRFIVNDTDNIPTELNVRAKSLTPSILNDQDINVQGIDFYRTLSIKSQRNNFGDARVQIIVSDGDKASSTQIPVIIKPINDAPSMVSNKSNLSLLVDSSTQLVIDYFDADSEAEALSLNVGSTNNRVISDDNISISHDVKNAKFKIDIKTKEDIIGDGLLFIELADESKATALQIPFKVSFGNRRPYNFQLVGAEPYLRNDSLLVDFSWTPSEDPDGKSLSYSIFIQNDKKDTVIHSLTTNEFTFRNNDFLSPVSNYSWYVKATDNSSERNKSNHIDSTLSLNQGSFVTPNFSQIGDWAEIEAIYPNPFNLVTKISFRIQSDAQVEIAIYDLSGRKIDLILDDVVSKGTYDKIWQPQNATTGLYICRITARRLIDGQTLRASKSVTYLPQ